MTPDSPFDPDHRARVVAGIRALADLIETRTDLPVPDGISAQYSLPDGLDDDGRQLVRDAADALGVKPEITEYRATARLTVAEHDWRANEPYFHVSYTVHGSRPEPDEDTDDQAEGVSRG